MFHERATPDAGRFDFRRIGLCLVVAALAALTSQGLTIASSAGSGAGTPFSQWSVVPADTPHDAYSFGNMSCVSTDDCLSAGYGYNSSGTAEVPYAEHWNGTKWTVTNLPIKSPDIVEGLHCLSTGICWLAGGTAWKGNNATILLKWDGEKWLSTNFAAQQAGFLGDIACPAVDECIAVGWAESAAGSSTAIAQEWKGKTWQTLKPAQPTKQYYAALYQIDCPSPSDCLALGQEQSSRATFTHAVQANLLGERWHSGVWTVVKVPDPPPIASGPLKGVPLNVFSSDISCTATNFCLAVGDWSPDVLGRSTETAVVERWDGSYWSMGTVPKAFQSDTLSDLSCVSTSLCWIVGAGVDPKTTGPDPVALYWNGSSLASGQAAKAHASGQLFSTDCVAHRVCYALGTVYDSTLKASQVIAESVPVSFVLTVRAASGSMTFGHPVPPITASYSGFVNGDSASSALSGSPACSTTATSGADPGTYATSCSAGTLVSTKGTYIFHFDRGRMVVKRARPKIRYRGPFTVRVGEKAKLGATLVSDIGRPLGGRSVTFTLSSSSRKTTCKSTTVARTGRSACTVSVSAPAGTDTVTIRFAGDSKSRHHDYTSAASVVRVVAKKR